MSVLVAVALCGIAAIGLGLLLERSAQRRARLVTVGAHGGPKVGVVTPPVRPSIRVRKPSVSTLLYVASAIGYIGLAAYLVLHEGSVIGDSQSRVANAYAVLFSRDPHLAAIGFVWGPLPSLLEMPLLLFKGWWPALAERAFAGSIVSALFMAGAVVQMRQFCRELGASEAVSWVLTAAFGLNPMILYYGANGMSEAASIFFLLVTARYLARWIEFRGVRPLVIAGCALALGYLVRYEFAAVAGAAAIIVIVVSFARVRGDHREREATALADVAVLIMPFVFAFIGWAVISFVITGHFFEQFSSQYGNSSQVQAGGGVSSGVLGSSLAMFGGKQLLLIAPLLPIVGVVTVFLAWERRDTRVWALSIFAASLGVTYFAFVSGGAFPFFRYYLPALPLMLLCIAVMFSPARTEGSRSISPPIAAALALLLASSSIISVAWTMDSARLAPEEYRNVAWVVTGVQSKTQRDQRALLASAQTIQRDLDGRALARGAVLSDFSLPCTQMVVMLSDAPRQFVLATDRSFQRTLADPRGFGADYLLVPKPAGSGSLDALNHAYPQLYENGNGFAKLVHQYKTEGCQEYRLYHVVSSPTSPTDVG